MLGNMSEFLLKIRIILIASKPFLIGTVPVLPTATKSNKNIGIVIGCYPEPTRILKALVEHTRF